jgi:hypothetical protein
MADAINEPTIIIPTQMEVSIQCEDDVVTVTQKAEAWEENTTHRIRLNSKTSIDALIAALTEFREYI